MALNPMKSKRLPNIPCTARWSRNGTTVISGLNTPCGIAIDQENGTLFVADNQNNRIVCWKPGDSRLSVVVTNINNPADILFDKQTNSIIARDYQTRKLLRYFLESNEQNEILIDNIDCCGLTMNDRGDIYVSDYKRNEVRQYTREKMSSIIVAGGNGQGSRLDQLNNPGYIAIDNNDTLYISDNDNRRITKWLKGAKEGTIVADFEGDNSSHSKKSQPNGIIVDTNGRIYVAEEGNNCVTRWQNDKPTADFVVEKGTLSSPEGLCFDSENNLYVVERDYHRVQCYRIVE